MFVEIRCRDITYVLLGHVSETKIALWFRYMHRKFGGAASCEGTRKGCR